MGAVALLLLLLRGQNAAGAAGVQVGSSSSTTATCSTQGPATFRANTRRNAAPTTVLPRLSPAQCADSCCNTAGCMSWEVDTSNGCRLFDAFLVDAEESALGHTSGVVYRSLPFQATQWGQIRGFNYVPSWAVNDIDMWHAYDRATVERDMGIAQKAGFNFARVFLNYVVWATQGRAFLRNLQHFVATAHAHGIRTMPIPFDMCQFGCGAEAHTVNVTGKCWYSSPQFTHADNVTWWTEHGQPYVDALVGPGGLPSGTPGLMLWDVVNEPETGGASGLPGDHGGPRWAFVRHMVGYVNNATSTPTTVGVASVQSLAHVADVVDVLTFHSYHASWDLGLARVDIALGYARRHQKPVFNSETGCIARANAYDQTIELALRTGLGVVVWELMISDCLDCIDTRRWKYVFFRGWFLCLSLFCP